MLGLFRKAATPKPILPDQTETVRLCGEDVTLRIRRSQRARRLRLRVDGAADAVELVLPARVPLAEGMALLDRHAQWVMERIRALPPRLRFADGALLPVLSRELVICHRPEGRRGAWVEDSTLNVSGGSEHLARRVTDWLRREAKREFTTRAETLAAKVNRRITGVTLRDPRSRWGSCTVGGGLSFSWRLVMAPEPVFDYVIAHEVAHLVEHNHSPRFWAVVARLHPEAETARGWLKRHGPALYRAG